MENNTKMCEFDTEDFEIEEMEVVEAPGRTGAAIFDGVVLLVGIGALCC